MKIIVFIAFALCVSATHAAEFQFPKDWKIQVTFPKEPQIARIPLGVAGARLSKTMISCTKDGVQFTMIVDSPMPEASHADARKRLYEKEREIAAFAHAKILKDEETILGRLSGRHFLLLQEGVVRIEKCVFLLGDALYTIAVSAPPAVDIGKLAEPFFHSMKLQEEPSEPRRS